MACGLVKHRDNFTFTFICAVKYLNLSRNFPLHHRVQNGSGAHPASYPIGTRGSFLGVKRPGREADHSPPSSAEVKECLELYLHSPNTPSWHGAYLSTGTTLPLPLLFRAVIAQSV
jgi:hypothetical protein